MLGLLRVARIHFGVELKQTIGGFLLLFQFRLARHKLLGVVEARFLHRLGVANPYGRGWLTVLLVFFLALLFTWRFLPHVRRFALKVGWADLPNERRLNREPLPNAGGLALYAGVVLALVVAAFLRPILVEQVLIQVLAILLGGAWLVLVGFIDDQFGLPPLFRLFVQTLSALLLVAGAPVCARRRLT